MATDLPPVLLLHGLGGSAARTWGDNGWLDLLADVGRTTIAPDLLGHGSAAKPHDPAAYDRMEEEVLDQLPAGPIDAVAFSLGAKTVLTLASIHPDRFRRIVVAGVGANLFRNDGGSALLAAALRSDGLSDDPMARYFQQLAGPSGSDPHAMAALLERPGGPRLTPESCAAITMPVCVVLGDRDFAGPADPLVDALPDARLVTLPGTDHFATPKHFGFIDAALDFLAAG